MSYEQYGLRAKLLADPYMATARLPKDRHKLPFTLDDIAAKLHLTYTDRLLDIGCGVGDLTIPLSFRVSDTLGIDHPDCVARLKRRLPEDRVRVIGADWMTYELKESFTKILIYDAIHYLGTIEEVEHFIAKAVAVLESKGWMLIGDIPSADMRLRHDLTSHGRDYNIAWNNDMDRFSGPLMSYRPLTDEESDRVLEKDKDVVRFDDVGLIGLMTTLRARGYQAWLVPQGPQLPFTTQREDLLVQRP